VDWKLILKRKLSNSEFTKVISILGRDLQQSGMMLEHAGIQSSEFSIGEDALTFPRNFKVTVEGHHAIFALDFELPNMSVNIRHIKGDKDLTDIVHEYLLSEQSLINRMIRAISPDSSEDIAYG
jgi:hypothetical protein